MTVESTTRRLISAYADEKWKSDHVEAQFCCEVEEHLAWAVRLFKGLFEFEARAQSQALGGSEEATIADLDGMTALYAMWLKATERCLPVARTFMDRGYAVEGLDAFEKAIAEASWIVESAAIEARLCPRDDLANQIELGNPDPERYGH